MNLLICGLGSIGKRHYNNLKNKQNVNLYAYRTGKSTLSDEFKFKQVFTSIEEIKKNKIFDGVIISNPTSEHIKTALQLKELKCPFFIEKPLSNTLEGTKELEAHFKNFALPCMLGYHVIFHPCYRKVEQIINSGILGDVISCKAYNGSYLPKWHPWEDYKNSYASKKEMGGGVTLTMIHELNYTTQLFGKITKLAAMGIEKNILDIDVDQGTEILLKHDSGVVSNIHLNFYQKRTERWLKIVGTKKSLFWDFWKSEIVLDDEIIKFEKTPLELLEQSYSDEIEFFAWICSCRLGANPIPLKKGTELSDGIEDIKIAINLLECNI